MSLEEVVDKRNEHDEPCWRGCESQAGKPFDERGDQRCGEKTVFYVSGYALIPKSNEDSMKMKGHLELVRVEE